MRASCAAGLAGQEHAAAAVLALSQPSQGAGTALSHRSRTVAAVWVAAHELCRQWGSSARPPAPSQGLPATAGRR